MPHEISTDRDAAHASALTSLADAREGLEHLTVFAAAAAATPGRDEAADLRDAGAARVAAGEAWLDWVDTGVGSWGWAMARDASDAHDRGVVMGSNRAAERNLAALAGTLQT